MPADPDAIAFDPPADLADAQPTASMSAPCVDPPPPAGACLVHVYPRGRAFGHRFLVGPDPVVIGRGAGADVRTDDDTVSREHARVELRADGRYYVADLYSRNGTFVNDRPARDEPLCDGDLLRVGSSTYRFLAGAGADDGYDEELYLLTVLDPLTRAHNRRSLMHCLRREVARAARYGRPLSALAVRLDGLGDAAGALGPGGRDFVLQAVAGRLRDVLRGTDVLARAADDVFATVMPETPADMAGVCGKRLRGAVADAPFGYDGLVCRLTASVGVAGWRPWMAAPEDVLAAAERELEAAVRAGGDRVRVADPSAGAPESPRFG